MKRYTWIIAAVAGVAAVIVGLSQGQGILVLNWARILCTSCIGLSD
ncbi:MAG: thioredoxin [candidate division WS1 bacterium]|nr:thioredoxin [candidate division WS1 bacterium]